MIVLVENEVQLNEMCRGYLCGIIIHDLEEAFHDIRIERLEDFAQFIVLTFNQVKVDEETGTSCLDMCKKL